MSQQPQHKPRVAVVFGGRSTEHAISCVSAGSVLRAIDRDRYDVVPIGITTEGRWVLAADEPDKLAITDGRLPRVEETGSSVVLSADPTGRGLQVHEAGHVPETLGDVDVVLPLLHGPYGEDGTIQGLLELAGVRYVGSGVLASAVSMDKAYTKLVLEHHGIPVVPYTVVGPRDLERDPDGVRAAAAALGWPVFVKPARGGSSIGVVKVHGPDELDAGLAEARRHDPKLIVETAVAGRELECGVLEGEAGGPPEASVVGELRVSGGHEFYDFDAKYLEGTTELDIPADVPPAVSDQARRLATRAFEALSCEGLARVDFFLRSDGSLVLNEVNTMPGFTPISMFPQLWGASGIDYPALVDRMVRTALSRPAGLR